MVALENELVDSYVRGDLSESEKQEFEQGYLTSAQAEKNLQFARCLPPIQPKEWKDWCHWSAAYCGTELAAAAGDILARPSCLRRLGGDCCR